MSKSVSGIHVIRKEKEPRVMHFKHVRFMWQFLGERGMQHWNFCHTSFMVFGFHVEDCIEFRNSRLECIKSLDPLQATKLNKHVIVWHFQDKAPLLCWVIFGVAWPSEFQTGRFMNAGNKSSWENAFCNLFPVTFLDCWELYSQQYKVCLWHTTRYRVLLLNYADMDVK